MTSKSSAVWLLPLLWLFSHASVAAELEGKVQWLQPLTLATNLAAEVVKVAAAPGQRINKGTLLLQLEDQVARARLAQARSEFAHQKLLLAEAESELQRSEELYDRTLLADHDLVLARIAHAAADSSYQQAAAELEVARRAVALTRIVAPFDALVLERYVERGETVNGQYTPAPLISLVDAAQLRVRVEVEAKRARALKLGGSVALEVAGQEYTGSVAAISASGERGVIVDVAFSPAEDSPLLLGETARVKLP
jgi:RND family efflux transporter MFP subunit